MYHASASIWALVLIGVAGISGTTALVLHRGGVAAGTDRRERSDQRRRSSSQARSRSAVRSRGGRLPRDERPGGTVVRRSVRRPPRHPFVGNSPCARAPHPGPGRDGGLVGLAARVPVRGRGLPDRDGPGSPPGCVRTACRHRRHRHRHCGTVGRAPRWWTASRAGVQRLRTARPVVAVALGSLVGLGPYVAVHVSPTTEPLALLPLSLIPAGVVPLLMALHIVSFRRLLAAPAVSGRGGLARHADAQAPDASLGRTVVVHIADSPRSPRWE